jgi:hypothetical protein
MKLPFSHDEIFRGALILLLGVVFGIILGLLRFCEATPQDVRTQLPEYNPFKEGVPPLIDNPAQYSDFVFSFQGLPRFVPPWIPMIKSNQVLALEDWDKEWDLLGDATSIYHNDQELERALDEILLNR